MWKFDLGLAFGREIHVLDLRERGLGLSVNLLVLVFTDICIYCVY